MSEKNVMKTDFFLKRHLPIKKRVFNAGNNLFISMTSFIKTRNLFRYLNDKKNLKISFQQLKQTT